MDTDKKRILMLIPNLGFGGAERSFSKLSLSLAERYEVFVAVFNLDSYTEKKYEHGGTFINLEVTTGPRYWHKISAFFERVKKVRKIKKEKRIDVCISFLEGADYINILSACTEKKVLSIRGSKRFDNNINGTLGALRKKILMPLLYNKADFIVTVNDGITQELRTSFKIKDQVKIVKIYNFYDFPRLKERSNLPIDSKFDRLFASDTIISHGRLSPEKGYHLLMPVFARILIKHPDAKLVLIGDGTYIEQLKSVCKDNELTYTDDAGSDANVFFLGFQDNPLKFLSKATLFVLTSFTEGFPNAVVEAMISGAPVVSTDCPWGPRDILEGKPMSGDIIDFNDVEYTPNGVLMPLLDKPGATEKWADTISSMFKSPDLRDSMADHASKRATEFTEETSLMKWFEIIDN